MKSDFLSRFIKNELFIGSLILLIMISISNLLNYFFHFSMARMLGPADYSVLAVLTSLIYIFNVPTLSIQTIASKYSTKFNSKKQFGKINSLFVFLTKKLLIFSFFAFIAFAVISIFLAKSLDISFGLLTLTGTILFGMFLSPIAIGILQGTKKFKVWGINAMISSLIKLIIAIALVFFGFKIYGAVIGFIIGTTISFFLALPFIKRITKDKRKDKQEIKIFSSYDLATFFAMLFFVIMFSCDVILAKKFFSPELAGKYSVASMIGKMLLFSIMSISSVMFPISSEKFLNGQRTRGVVKKTFFISSVLCGLALILSITFPKLIIKILFGSQYVDVSGILIYLMIAFSAISFLNILILYKISKNKLELKHIIFMGLFLATQIILLSLFHKTIYQFSIVFMLSAIISFIGSLILIRSK